jgi:hypothetical protein
MLRQRLGNAARSVSKPFSEPRVVARWHEVLYGQTPIRPESLLYQLFLTAPSAEEKPERPTA